MKKSLFLCAFLGVCACLSAQPAPQRVPAIRTPIEYVQPSGDTLTYYLRGDEWHHFTMTLDGYLIQQNRKDCFCYAYYRKDGSVKITCRAAKNADKRSKCEQKWLQKHIPNKLQTPNETK